MSTPGHKPQFNPFASVSSSSEEDDEEEEEDESPESDSEYEDADEYFECGDNYSGNGRVPYVSLPLSEPSSKWTDNILSQLGEIAKIYIKFAVLAIIIYSAVLWYTVRYGDTDSINSESDPSNDKADSETCPADYSASA